MGVGSLLRRLIEARGTNVNEVATATGVNPQTLYSLIKRDSAKANIEDLYKVAHHLGVTLEYFYDGDQRHTLPPLPSGDKSPSGDVAAVLREQMDQRGWSEPQLAERCQLPLSLVNDLLSHRQQTLSLDTAVRLARGLEISLDELGGYAAGAGPNPMEGTDPFLQGSELPEIYLHLLKGAKEMDLDEHDVNILLNIARTLKEQGRTGLGGRHRSFSSNGPNIKRDREADNCFPVPFCPVQIGGSVSSLQCHSALGSGGVEPQQRHTQRPPPTPRFIRSLTPFAPG